MQINITLDAEQLAERTNGMAERLADFTPYWEAVASPMVAGWFQSIWETEGANINGAPWAPLSETTLALKAKRGRGAMGVLRDSDRLFHSLTVRGDADQLRNVSPLGLFYGTAANRAGAPYPLYQQKGWTMSKIFGHVIEPPRDVPARPFVPASLPGGWGDAIRGTILDYVQHGLGGVLA
jgi:hypothetical protein